MVQRREKGKERTGPVSEKAGAKACAWERVIGGAEEVAWCRC